VGDSRTVPRVATASDVDLFAKRDSAGAESRGLIPAFGGAHP